MRLAAALALTLAAALPAACARPTSATRADGVSASPAVVKIDTPLPAPAWALLQRQLLRANARACRAFYDRYFDDRGFLECVDHLAAGEPA